MKGLLDTHTFIAEGATLISVDQVFGQYPVKVLW
jgi:hypothetical protein